MRLTSLLVAAAVAALPAPAGAQVQVFAEDFESGSASWYALDGQPIVIQSDANLCSSKYKRETILYSGGRVFVRSGIKVDGGKRHCLTAWVRGSANTQPFLGINLSDAGGARGAEHWLIGNTGYGNGYGGTVTAVTSDAKWHWYTAAFTLEAAATHVVIKTEIFQGGAAGTADFDDIRLYADACPTTPAGAAHAACAAPNAICRADGLCVQCTDADKAACTGDTPVCDTTPGACVGCLAAADCKDAAKPICDEKTKACRGCAGDSECPAEKPVCQASGACGECSATNAAKCVDDKPICDTAKGLCRGCASDADCSGATPACQASGRCGQCSATNAKQCAGKTPVCDAAKGLCAVCLTTGVPNGCEAVADGHACLMGTGVVFCGCNKDADCGAVDSGRVCDAALHNCADGCSPAAGRNGCPKGEYCTSDDATGAMTGLCTKTCNFDRDCPTDTPYCLKGMSGSSCVACRTDAECKVAPALVCTDQNACAECTAAKKDACAKSMAGAACLASGVCGCLADGDCGGAGSGRICDAVQSACVVGCRDGGDTCPADTTCVGGQCVILLDMTVPPDLATVDDLARPIEDLATSDYIPPWIPDLPRADAAVPSNVALAGGGCGCRVAATDGPPAMTLAVLALLALLALRRRRG